MVQISFFYYKGKFDQNSILRCKQNDYCLNSTWGSKKKTKGSFSSKKKKKKKKEVGKGINRENEDRNDGMYLGCRPN